MRAWRWKPDEAGLRGLTVFAAAAALACKAPAAQQGQGPQDSLAGCEVVSGGPGGPVTDPNGPYYHQSALAHTSDGVTLSGAHQVLDHASVPDGVRRPDGTVLVYYVNGAQGAVWVARIEADTAAVLGPLVLNGVSAPGRVVDPDAYVAPDGKIRLAYFSGFGSPDENVAKAMCIAESGDGLQFTVMARALAIGSSETLTDPSVARLADGTWRMAISLGNRTVLASSADGLAFQRYDTLTVGGVPELALAPDGRLRLYVCANGIVSLVSADGGASWQAEAQVVPPGFLGKRIVCDPSLVAGTDLFVFKTAD